MGKAGTGAGFAQLEEEWAQAVDGTGGKRKRTKELWGLERYVLDVDHQRPSYHVNAVNIRSRCQKLHESVCRGPDVCGEDLVAVDEDGAEAAHDARLSDQGQGTHEFFRVHERVYKKSCPMFNLG